MEKFSFENSNWHLEIKKSNIHGKGTFTKKAYSKGDVVVFFCRDVVIPEHEYKKIANDEFIILRTGVRYVDDWIIANRKFYPEDYFNHSDTPNILYHLGVGFALREIKIGEELFSDYRLFLPDGENIELDDGTIVTGFSAKESLKESTRQLIDLLSSGSRAPSIE